MRADDAGPSSVVPRLTAEKAAIQTFNGGPEQPRPALQISVILPLYDRRVDEERCVRSWVVDQTFPRASYEVVVLSDGSNPSMERRLEKLLSGHDSLVRKPGASMMGLYHFGAQRARARMLFFTEFHCMGEPDCLEQLWTYLQAHDFDGACVRTIPECPNAFASVEHGLFEELFGEWSQPGDWRKIFVRGVAISSEAYFEAGGFNPTLSYFSDWALAASLDAHGRRLGYAPTAAVRHCYNVSYSQFSQQVRDRAQAECRYRLAQAPAFSEQYFGTPADWQNRESSRPIAARAALWILVKSLRRSIVRRDRVGAARLLAACWRRVPWAVWGVLGPLLWLRATRVGGRVRCGMARDREDRLRRAYLYAYRQITRYYMLYFIARRHREALESPRPGLSFEMGRLPDGQLWGFQGVERWNGQQFRWTGAVGVLRLSVPPGTYRVEIDVLPVRGGLLCIVRDAYFNGRSMGRLEIDEAKSRIVGRIDPWMFKAGGEQRLALVSIPIAPFADPAEPRELGMPVAAVRLLQTSP
jgi:hypothetical protein